MSKVMRSTLCDEFLSENEVQNCSMIESEDEGSFSRSGCDCCQTGLGVTIYACNGWNPKARKVVELGDVCHECICYFYNGDDSEVES